MLAGGPAYFGAMLRFTAALFVLVRAQLDRDVVNFDFAWRFASVPECAAPRSGVPPEAAPDFGDASWEVVDAPHDMLISGRYSPQSAKAQAFLPRGCGWYRKHFVLPEGWDTASVWVYFEGIFHEATLWLNGRPLGFHQGGYTSFWYPLAGSGVKYGAENVLAVHVNASSGTGWWYEGGGLSRHQYLIRAPSVFMPPDRSWAFADTSKGTVRSNGKLPADGLSATGASFVVEATVRNGLETEVQDVSVEVTFYEGSDGAAGDVVASGRSAAQPIAVSEEKTFRVEVPIISAVQLWSVARPFLHTAVVDVKIASRPGDSQNITFGARAIGFDADQGFFLNGYRTKMRGFCDHSTFAGVGSAVPDRVNLFRAQMLRAVGANSWRMAHNPPVPFRLDIMDRLGMLAMDENRDYGGHKGQGGNTSEDVVQELRDMADMVQRDRSHPSVVLWSLCNEVGCNNETAARDFRAVATSFDGTRPVTQNHLGTGDHPLSMFSLDVQGMSHKDGSVMDTFHKNNPAKPVLSSECCSCMSQRGVDQDFCPTPQDGGGPGCTDLQGHGGHDGVFYNNNIAECTAEQVQWSDSRDFNAGTFVWSGFDYLGESRGWPQSAKCRGTVADVAGFEKETRWWLRSWWLSNISQLDHGRPVLWQGSAQDVTTVYIVESWVKVPHSDNRTIHVYTNAPWIRLWLNGEIVASSGLTSRLGSLKFKHVKFAAGNLTAEALTSLGNGGMRLGTCTALTPGAAVALRLSLDAPSPHTGTGTALVADGSDVAMVRVEMVDDAGVLVTQDATAFAEVTVRVVSGAGVLLAVHSGGPADVHPTAEPTTRAYHGLVRALIRSAEDAATSPVNRRLLREITLDLGRGAFASTVRDPSQDARGLLEPIVVEAVSPGLPPARLEIPVTRDLSQRPLAVAASLSLVRWHSADEEVALV